MSSRAPLRSTSSGRTVHPVGVSAATSCTRLPKRLPSVRKLALAVVSTSDPAAATTFGSGTSGPTVRSGATAGATAGKPVVAYVSLYRDSVKVFETQAIQGTPVAGSRLGVVPLSFTLKLNQLPPGEYDCQVSVLDPTGAKSTFWQAPIKLVP